MNCWRTTVVERGQDEGSNSSKDLWASLLDENYRERLKVIISTLGLGATVAAAISLYLSYQDSIANRINDRKQLEISEQRLTSEQFSRAAELLSKRQRTIRIAAIYSLERIAIDSPDKYHWTIMELLSADAVQKSLMREDNKIPIDILASLTVIGRRQTEEDPANKTIELKTINLSDLNLSNENFSGVNLSDADLSGAILKDVDFSEANLSRSDLRKVNLSGANLDKANLCGAEGLYPEGIKAAKNWQMSIYDKTFREKLDLQLVPEAKRNIEVSNCHRSS